MSLCSICLGGCDDQEDFTHHAVDEGVREGAVNCIKRLYELPLLLLTSLLMQLYTPSSRCAQPHQGRCLAS